MGNLSSLRSSAGHTRSLRAGHQGKRHFFHAGSEVVEQFLYRDWKIKIAARQTGVTMRRSLFVVFLEGPCAPFHHKIERQSSKPRAIQAAKQLVDRWYEENGERWAEAKRRQEKQAYFESK